MLIAGALGAALVYEALRWLNSVADEAERARERRFSYDAGVTVGRELQRALHTGQAPFPPAEFGDDFPRYGVEHPWPDHCQPPGDDRT